MDIDSFFQSKKFKWILAILGSLIILLVIFSIGMYVGTQRANFSYRWGENYHRMFGGPQGGFLQDFAGRDYIAGHGTVGTVMKIEEKMIIIKGTDGVEKTISANDQTTIRRGADTIKITDLTINNQVVVIGSPKDDGTIEAEFIRVFDPSRQAPPQSGFMPFPFPKF